MHIPVIKLKVTIECGFGFLTCGNRREVFTVCVFKGNGKTSAVSSFEKGKRIGVHHAPLKKLD
jgi:hypothetical protein